MLIQSIRTQRLDELTEPIDLLICACGYESRSIYIASKLEKQAKRKFAFGFTSQQVLFYSSNRTWFEEHGFIFVDTEDKNYATSINDLLTALPSSNEPIKLAIDISCLNRLRLAGLVNEIRCNRALDFLDISFVYNLAKFSEPNSEYAPTSVAEPVTPEFSGWTTQPDLPPAAVIGLGYEESRAIGIVDHLEINNAAWAFVPHGPIEDYSGSVDEANKSFYSMLSIEGRKLMYEVDDPASLFRELNSLIDSLKSKYNPIIVPFGPKIFALVSLLVASLQDEVGVWRVSSGLLEKPVDRKPSEHVTALRVLFAKTSNEQ